MSFSICVRHVDDITIIDLVGRVVLGQGAAESRAVITDVVNSGHKKIVVNLAAVDYIDSSGLGEFVSAYASVSKVGGEIKLASLQKRIYDLIQITKLNMLFASFPDENAAIKSFKS